MHRALYLPILAGALVGCTSYVEPIPGKLVEGDHAANYGQVFREPIPRDVNVVNSAVITHVVQPGFVRMHDFEFEMIAPRSWIQRTIKRFSLVASESEFTEKQIAGRRELARPWYAPKPLSQYDLYRDAASAGSVHMLVETTGEADGKQRVFISRH